MDEKERTIKEIFMENDCEHLYQHSIEVAETAKLLAEKFGISRKVYLAGLLHDIGGIIPVNKRVEKAIEYKLDLYDEEIKFPLIIHQKLSKYIARNTLNIEDDCILSAIECHTTLKEKYSGEDLIVFIADKISWDQKGVPPYLNELKNELDKSLENAALFYINFILENNIKVVHPWLELARNNLIKNIEKGQITKMIKENSEKI